MAAAISGRSSVEQDADLVRRMHEIPKTPIKMSATKMAPKSAQRRRGLFIPASPASSDSSGGLGHMSPLSSSMESLPQSPTFSPNGECIFETPKKTPSRNITVKSALFPALQRKELFRSPTIRHSIALLQDIVGDSESSQSTPRSSRSRHIIPESIASPSSVGTPPSQRKGNTIVPASPIKATPDSKSVAETDFYGAPIVPKPVTPENFYAPCPKLVIDTLASRSRKLMTEQHGVNKRRRSSSRSASRSGKRHKSAIPGVWHGVKKPRKLNKSAPKPKPVVSPLARIEKLQEKAEKRNKAGKRLFQEKPLKRFSAGKNDEEGIIDTFPSPRIKRKKLPSSPVKEPEPDESKKFLKFGSYRKATFKINNMQLEFTKGQVRVKTPEKRRRLLKVKKPAKAQLDPVDFSIAEPETEQIQKDVDNILKQLIEGDEMPKTPEKSYNQIETYTDDQLINILESPSTKVALIEATPTKMMTDIQSSPQRSLLANMSSLKLNDLTSTGGILTQATSVLNDTEVDQENAKYFPLFDPKTWKPSTSPLKDLTNTPKKSRRKGALFGDDQYLLDAGQKSIGVITCKECGVMYQAGDYLDELAHNNVHNHLHELSFHGWKDERVVTRFNDGRIVMITPTDPKPWREKAKKVVGVVDLELGFSENSLKWTTDKKVLLFICEKLKQVVGCLVMENCEAGYRMYPSIEGIEVDTCARDSSPCKIGVSRIWTAVHRRRRSVASRMFQALCRISGDVSPDDVAFSIPSPDGKMLARKVIGREDFKVYGFISS